MPSARLRSGADAGPGAAEGTVDDGVVDGGIHGAAWALRTGWSLDAPAPRVFDDTAGAGADDGPAAADDDPASGGRPSDFHAAIESFARAENDRSDGCSRARTDGSAERDVWASIGGSVKRSASGTRGGTHLLVGSGFGGARTGGGARLYETGAGPRRIDDWILIGGGGDFGAGRASGGGDDDDGPASWELDGPFSWMIRAAVFEPFGDGPGLVERASGPLILTSCDAGAKPPCSCEVGGIGGSAYTSSPEDQYLSAAKEERVSCRP